jgi:molybdate/tungstate transport system substrate-binding protein
MRGRRLGLGLGALLGLTVAAGVGPLPAVEASASGSPGMANVACAGSLQLVMDQYVGPAFTTSTGYQYQVTAMGSLGLAQEIAAGEVTPNVFIPVGAAPMALLEPKFTTWALQFAASPLVVAYYPKGAYASELKQIAKGQLPILDLFNLMATPGFRLGRTDPAVDPQGQAFEMMIKLAEKDLGVPAAIGRADLGGANGSSQIFSETALEPTLQAGELDAASAYLPQAVQLGLPYIALPSSINFGDPADAAAYRKVSITLSGQVVHGSVLNLEASVLKGWDPAAAAAFVAFLFSSKGQHLLTKEGYMLLKPTLLGKVSEVPRSIREALRKG